MAHPVFLVARLLADHNYFCILGSFTENDLGGMAVQIAAPAVWRSRAEPFQAMCGRNPWSSRFLMHHGAGRSIDQFGLLRVCLGSGLQVVEISVCVERNFERVRYHVDIGSERRH